ncbi:MAG: transcriptional repressor [Eubacteriales bacterium]|nr:transcriptional repressor [Eubacteriales bacterium]
MERRHTIQKELVLNAVRKLKSHVTADEVYQYILNEHPSVGKGTVYRNLNILAEEGEIRKIAIPNGPDHFDFTLHEHYHVRCMHCGNVSDVDMDVIPNLKKKIHDTHGVEFLDYDILFRGICPECQIKQQNMI